MEIKLNEKELIELGRYIEKVVKNCYTVIDIGKATVLKITEIIQHQRIIIITYLKASEVKLNTREKINKLSENAVNKLINEVLEVHLKRKPTEEDFKKVRFSHETNDDHRRFVYFPEGKYLGEYLNVKEGGFFKLIFKFARSDE